MLIFAQYYAKCAQNRAFLGLKVVENVKNALNLSCCAIDRPFLLLLYENLEYI